MSHSDELLAEFRRRYHRFGEAIVEASENGSDSNVLERLGDDLDEYLVLANQVSRTDCYSNSGGLTGHGNSIPIYSRQTNSRSSGQVWYRCNRTSV